MYYKMTYSLADMVIHMIEDIQFNPPYVNEHSPSNHAIARWYIDNSWINLGTYVTEDYEYD